MTNDRWSRSGRQAPPVPEPPESPAAPSSPSWPPPPPADLGEHGRSLWVDVVAVYRLRADELRILRRACRELDLVEHLDAERARTNVTTTLGSQGQRVADPLVTEIRLYDANFRQLINSLKLPDPNGAAGKQPLSTSELARKAARARWDRTRSEGQSGG